MQPQYRLGTVPLLRLDELSIGIVRSEENIGETECHALLLEKGIGTVDGVGGRPMILE